MLLENKNAVVYGAGGAIGGAVARAFASEGPRLFLAGRGQASLDRVAAEIARAGGAAEIAQVDALDERAVEVHAASVAAQAGGTDISFSSRSSLVLAGQDLQFNKSHLVSSSVLSSDSTAQIGGKSAAVSIIARTLARSGLFSTDLTSATSASQGCVGPVRSLRSR